MVASIRLNVIYSADKDRNILLHSHDNEITREKGKWNESVNNKESERATLSGQFDCEHWVQLNGRQNYSLNKARRAKTKNSNSCEIDSNGENFSHFPIEKYVRCRTVGRLFHVDVKDFGLFQLTHIKYIETSWNGLIWMSSQLNAFTSQIKSMENG